MDEKKIEETVKDILKRLHRVEDKHEVVELLNGLLRGDRELGTPGLKSIVYGSEALGVLPIRKEIEELDEKIDELHVKMDRFLLWEGRVKWVAGLFGVSSVVTVATFIIVMRELLGI